jgi:hypothetical protein
MPTHSRTDPRSTQARFGRTATPPRRRPSVPARPAIPGRRRTPERSPLDKAVQSVRGALPTGGKTKSKSKGKSRSSSGVPKGKGLAGLAALAGAAGVALSQRDKISSLVKRGGDHDGEGRATQQAGPVPPSATPPIDQPMGAPAPERGTGI